MIHSFADHRSDDAKIIGAVADMGEQVADRDAALARVFEGPRRFHQRPGFFVGESERALHRQRLTVIAIEPRLGIERIDARGTTVHEQKDHTFGAGSKVRLFGREGIERGFGRLRLSGKKVRQTEITDAAAGGAQHCAAGHWLFFLRLSFA